MKLLFFQIFYVTCILLSSSFINGQSLLNYTPTKTILEERQKLLYPYNIQNSLFPVQISYSQSIFYNNNLPNLENHNGLYLPKGFGSLSGILIYLKNKFIILSGETWVSNYHVNPVSIKRKKSIFSVLNDVPLDNKEYLNQKSYRNLGAILHFDNFGLGYGTWNRWWGPGIHNSLVMSNNAEGMPHFFAGTLDYKKLVGKLEYNFKYTVSNAMMNNIGSKFFLSSYYLNLRYSNVDFGKSKQILSGGNRDLSWDQNDALSVIFTQKNIKYWDQIIDYYISFSFPSSGLKLFMELGFPNRDFNSNNPDTYADHAMGSNFGLRKYGAFNNKKLMFGFEYTRLIQGLYYNIMPTPNWYDNIKYNYSSYNNRRWAAHSGSDSDDLLVFFGYINKIASFVYGINYERHGVTYHFPPEVKLESRISASYKYKNVFIYLNYESEYFDHYGFVDNNQNVWLEEFEAGSRQRTQTLLLSIEYLIYN